MNESRFHHTVTYLSRPPGISEDAWDLFCAAAEGDLEVIRELIERDPELIHSAVWYEFPLHYAVRGGHVSAVELLLQAGTNPAWSNFRYSSWQKLLPIADQRGYTLVHQQLVDEMKRRFNYDPGYGELFDAIVKNSLDQVGRIIEQDPESIHVGDEHGNRALHWAVMARHLPIIEHLLDCGADIHSRRADMQTPLHLASVGYDYWFKKAESCDPHTDDADVVDCLLRRGAHYEFSAAVVRGDVDRVEELLATDASLATRLDESRRSPLGLGASHGRYEIVKRLLELGADPNVAEECCDRGAALFEACSRNDVPMVKLLLEHGADPNAESDSSGCCLTIAAHRRNQDTPEVQRLLRQHGAVDPLWSLENIDDVWKRLMRDPGLSPDDWYWGGILNRVVAMEDIPLLNEFIDRFGREPIRKLDCAMGWNLVEDAGFLDALIEQGMDVNRPDWYGQTCLHCCVEEKCDPPIAGQYLDRGADINAVDFVHGTSPLGVAAQHGNEAMIRFLMERGADPKLPDQPEWAQPISLAKREGHEEAVRLLEEYNAW